MAESTKKRIFTPVTHYVSIGENADGKLCVHCGVKRPDIIKYPTKYAVKFQIEFNTASNFLAKYIFSHLYSIGIYPNGNPNDAYIVEKCADCYPLISKNHYELIVDEVIEIAKRHSFGKAPINIRATPEEEFSKNLSTINEPENITIPDKRQKPMFAPVTHYVSIGENIDGKLCVHCSVKRPDIIKYPTKYAIRYQIEVEAFSNVLTRTIFSQLFSIGIYPNNNVEEVSILEKSSDCYPLLSKKYYELIVNEILDITKLHSFGKAPIKIRAVPENEFAQNLKKTIAELDSLYELKAIILGENGTRIVHRF